MADGETRTLESAIQSTGGSEAVEITITRHPSVVITGHFLLDRLQPPRCPYSGASTTITADVCWGGGFYTGWPIHIEINRNGETTTYQRFF